MPCARPSRAPARSSTGRGDGTIRAHHTLPPLSLHADVPMNWHADACLRKDWMSYRILPPEPGGRRDRRLRADARTRAMRQVAVSVALVSLAAGTFASEQAESLLR